MRPFPFGRSGIEAGQSDGGTILIQQDQGVCIQCLGLFPPGDTLLFLLFTCPQRLFLPRPSQARDRRAHGRGADLNVVCGFPELATSG
jgi:hypothetical protein